MAKSERQREREKEGRREGGEKIEREGNKSGVPMHDKCGIG